MQLPFNKKIILPALVLMLAAFCPALFAASEVEISVAPESGNGNLGVIKGIVRDTGGSPIANATVAIFRSGTSQLLKKVSSGFDGSYLARIVPGKYTVLAVANGFTAVTLNEVQVEKASLLNFPFKLARAGSGQTLPEKRLDRNNPKWVIRSAQAGRSIYQNQDDGDLAISEVIVEESTEQADSVSDGGKRNAQSVVETYFGGANAYAGINAATLIPIGNKAEIVIAGQSGLGRNIPQRIEAHLKYRPTDRHQLRFMSSYGTFGTFVVNSQEKDLGQFSAQILDEWKVREGVIIVFGVDYSRFTGVGDDFAISPRLGLQYDIDAKTRFRAAYTTQTEDRTWSRAVELEDSQVVFREPAAMQDFVIESGKPKMNKSGRLEFGIERVLDNKSSVEANVFFDTTLSRGVGLTAISFDTLNESGFGDFVGNQQGRTEGVRIVFSRRINGRLNASAGYSFGSGQRIAEAALSDPANLFQQDVFQTFFGSIEADFKTGTSVKTIYRLSPQATVFAIDPFQGRLAIYDPGLSVLVTQSLPTLGLPFHAEAILDARNLFGFQNGIFDEEGSIQISSQRRVFRGGISVRF